MDWMYITLILCLVASNFSRLIWILEAVVEYLTAPRQPALVPYFDEHGVLIGMVRLRPESNRRPQLRSESNRHPQLRSESNRRPQPRSRTHSVDENISTILAPRLPTLHSQVPLKRHAIPEIPFAWDFWPDGEYQSSVTAQELLDTHNVATNWVLETIRTGGSKRALTWQKGHELRWRCLGIIECHGKTCDMQLAPCPRAVDRHRQLQQNCVLCDETLRLRVCAIESSLYRYYQNGGTHDHVRPTVRIHLSKGEANEFAEIVKEQPETGPLKLLVGRPGADGPAASVAKISPVLVNADRIKYERRKVLKGQAGTGGDTFLKQFATFEADNPGFIRTAQFGKVAAIVTQTPFMAARLVKSTIVEAEAVNGIVSDAAHGVWAERNSLLIVSSVYEPVHLKCWVPGVITYANGGTAEHYRIHFFELFLSIGEECDRRGIEFTDDAFANVVDFSAAERLGFILAFVDIWVLRAPQERTIPELLDTAPKLLKGCTQHFRNQITRIKNISGVVDPAQADVFESFAKSLLRCESIEEFTSRAEEFIVAFPKAESWIRWWMLPAHACMLFPSFRVMRPDLWDSIPDTTNAEEAMHWKLYAALGKFLAILQGLKALVAFADYYKTQFEAKQRGVKIHYGEDREHWKVAARVYGRTKISRTPGFRKNSGKNDGRPPDTGKALLGKRKRQLDSVTQYEQGYKWKENSCWLDSSLLAIFAAASRDYSGSMDLMFADLPAAHPLLDLRQMVHTRRSVSLSGYREGGSVLLSKQRDGFRNVLHTLPNSPIESLTSFQTVFGWVYYLCNVPVRSQGMTPAVERATSYFRVSSVRLRSCSGLSTEHLQLERIKWREQISLHAALCEQYNGDLQKWFVQWMRPSTPSLPAPCWRGREGETFCDGDAHTYETVLNIPIVLMLEFNDTQSGSHWNIPKTLRPYPNNQTANSTGVKYSVASHIYSSSAANHFITRYSSNMTDVYDYDGRQHDGHAVLNSSRLKALVVHTDQIQGIPEDYHLHAVVYHLDGGESAQRYFRREQIRLAKKLGLHLTTRNGALIPSSCELRRPNLQVVSDDDRSPWLPQGSLSIDYIVIPPEKSPRKLTVPNRTRKRASSTISESADGSFEDSSWHPPMALAREPGNSVAPSSTPDREYSLPLIATISSPSRRSPDSGRRTLHCHPCAANGPAPDHADVIQCRKCQLWSHVACVRPLAYVDSDADSDSESVISWHDPAFNFKCILCKLQRETPQSDDTLVPGKLRMLPTMEDWVETTLWFPAEFLNFDVSRSEREYMFKWMPGIDSPENQLKDGTFYRSAAHWEAVSAFPRLAESQVGAVHLPLSFAQVPEDAPVLDDELARLFYLAVPTIAEILDRMDMSDPVIKSHEDFFKDEPYTLKKSVVWMRSCGFDPTPALESMLEEPLAALRAHPLMRADSDDSHPMVWGPGSVFLQVLAIQHSNGEPWDLNGQTFCDVRAGRLVSSPPRALEGLRTMWLSIDPVDVATENHWSFPEVSRYEAEFRAAHTIYRSPCDVVFYHRLQASPPATTPPVRIHYNGQNILTAADLPPDNRPPKRELRDVEDIVDVAPVKRLRGAKYEPKPTPPGVRRSQRRINKKK